MCERYRQRSDIDSGSHVGPITSQHINAGTPSDTVPGRRVGGTLRVSPLACVKSDTRPQRKIVSHPSVDGTLPTVLYIIPPELVFHLVHLITPVASPFSPPCPQAAAAAASGRKVCLTLSQQTLTQLHHKSLTFASSGPPATTTTTALRTGLLAGRVPVPDYRCQRCHR